MKVLKLLLLFVFIFFNCKQNNQNNSVNEKSKKQKIKGLNQLITNDLSVFKQSGYLDRQFNYFIRKWDMAGMSVAVIKNEKLVYAHGFGYSNIEKHEKVNPGNIFRVASVSKLLTAVGIVKLVQDGKLTLDSKVFGKNAILNDSIFNKVKDKRLYNVTIRNLLAHSGGWSQRYGDPAFNSLLIAKKVGDTPPATISTFYKYIASRRLHYTPGTSTSYSNMGYLFLGEVISKASGMPYEEYIRKEILIPNGIIDMHIGSSRAIGRRPNEVRYYEQKNSPLIACFAGNGQMVQKTYGGNPIELLGAAGGWVASSVELAKLLVLIDGYKEVKDIVPSYLLKEMINRERTQGPLGWIRVNKNNTWYRTGSMAGTSAMIKRGNDGISWVVLLNSSSWKGSRFTKEINALMTKVSRRVKKWPEKDLFNYYPLDKNTVF